jgi:hypothetical protein
MTINNVSSSASMNAAGDYVSRDVSPGTIPARTNFLARIARP